MANSLGSCELGAGSGQVRKKDLVPLLAAISVSTGCISYGLCMAYTSSAIPSMLAPNSSLPIQIGMDETTWMSSLLALGALVGSLSAVYLMDAVGRKASLLAFSVMSLFIGWTLLMASGHVWQLYLGRFLLGVGAGLELTISPVYIHEICRPVLRDVCGSFPQVCIALGILLCYALGRDLEWNWLALASCTFLVPFTFGLYFIPESPPWLVYNDEEDLAFKSMVLIRGEEYDATVEIRRIKEKLAIYKNDLSALLQETDHPHQANTTNTNTTTTSSSSSVLRERALFRPFVVVLTLTFLHQFSGQGAITFYTELIFTEAECIVPPNDCALIVGLTYFVSSIVGLVLRNHFGRRILLLVSELGMAMAQLLLALYFQIVKSDSTSPDSTPVDSISADSITSLALSSGGLESVNLGKKESAIRLDSLSHWLPLPLLMMFTASFNVGMGCLTWTLATEMLPARSQRLTHALASASSNLWWFVVTKTFKELFFWSHTRMAPFLLYGLVCSLGFLFVLLFLPETHNRSAEQIADAFRSDGQHRSRIALCSLCDNTDELECHEDVEQRVELNAFKANTVEEGAKAT